MPEFMALFRKKRRSVEIVFSHEYYQGISRFTMNGILDSMKFKKVRDMLVVKNLMKRKNILVPTMAHYADIALAHNAEYLNRIRNPLNVAKYLRIESVDPWDSDILEYFRIVTGGTILAALHAWQKNISVFNLGGGFHHAHHNKAAGYCLLNDVAVAIFKVRKVHPDIKKVLIIDLDYHQGDGNLSIFQNDQSVFTFSMNAVHWLESDKENNLDIFLSPHCRGEEYLSLLKRYLPEVLADFHPDLVFYIAGSDVYENDALGDLHLTREDMLQRNMFVFNSVIIKHIPLVIVAGGGYGSDSWYIYYDFIESAILN